MQIELTEVCQCGNIDQCRFKVAPPTKSQLTNSSHQAVNLDVMQSSSMQLKMSSSRDINLSSNFTETNEKSMSAEITIDMSQPSSALPSKHETYTVLSIVDFTEVIKKQQQMSDQVY